MSEREELLAKIDAALEEVFAICKGKRWTMCVPVQKNDSDVVIAEALRAARAALQPTPPPATGACDCVDNADSIRCAVHGEHARAESVDDERREITLVYPKDAPAAAVCATCNGAERVCHVCLLGDSAGCTHACKYYTIPCPACAGTGRAR